MVRIARAMDRVVTRTPSMLPSQLWVSWYNGGRTSTYLCAFAAKPVFLATLQDNMDYCLEQTTEFFCGSIQVGITRLPTGRPEKTKNKGDSYVR